MGLGAVVRLIAPPARRANRDKKETVSAREQADNDAAERKRREGKVPGAFLRSRRSYTPSRRARTATKRNGEPPSRDAWTGATGKARGPPLPCGALDLVDAGDLSQLVDHAGELRLILHLEGDGDGGVPVGHAAGGEGIHLHLDGR
jgi:hypothetical protein